MGNKVPGGGSSTSAPSADSRLAITKLNSSVYSLSAPEQPEVELVFIHGLQPWGFTDAYWKTWLARDGSNDNCWPSTWLKSKMPRARILSLSYDSSTIKTASTGTSDLYAVGESLVPDMLLAEIGQTDCPVVFVCHSLGGLVAKQIVLHAKRISSSDKEGRARLLQNIKGFFFYATPHFGSKLVDYAEKVLNVGSFKGLVLDYLKVLCKPTAILNTEFEQAHRQEFKHWKLYVIGESHDTKVAPGVYLRIVSEASAKFPDVGYMAVGEDHSNVCKPKTPTDSSFLKLVQFVETDVMEHKLQLGEIVDLR